MYTKLYPAMPRLPIDYSKGLIYRLVCRDVEVKEIYVGSTTDFASRKRGHKRACMNSGNKDHNIYVYSFIREHGGWFNWDMIMIETFPCNSKLELHTRERVHIEQLGATLNQIIPTRTREEYKITHVQQKKETGRKYYAEHAAEIAVRSKVYRESVKEMIETRQLTIVACECGSLVSKRNIAVHRKSPKHHALMASLIPEPEVAQVA